MYPDSYSFPPVPNTTDQFVSLGLNQRPVFFGCSSADNATVSGGNGTNSTSVPPLVIYLPNSPLPNDVPLTNSSTLQNSYSPATLQAIVDQAFNIAVRGSPTANSTSTNGTTGTSVLTDGDPMWPLCLACAVVDRARARSGAARDQTCQTCFANYCFS